MENDQFDITFSTANLDTSTTNNNTMIINSTSGNYELSGWEASLTSLTFGNSVYTFLTPASFTLNIPTSTGTNSVVGTMPAGSYSIADFNAFLQYVSTNNDFYLMNGSEPVYFIAALDNRTTYRVDLQFNPVPTSLPAGYTNPAGMTFPATAEYPSLTISDSRILRLLGFEAGTYPSSTTPAVDNLSVSGTEFPVENPNPFFFVFLNCATNTINRFSNYLSFVPVGNTPKGNDIEYIPPYPVWVRCTGSFPQLVVSIKDMNGSDVIQQNTGWGGSIKFRKAQPVYKAVRDSVVSVAPSIAAEIGKVVATELRKPR